MRGRRGNKGNKATDLANIPRMASLRQRCVSSFLPSAGGQGSEQRHFVRHRGRVL